MKPKLKRTPDMTPEQLRKAMAETVEMIEGKPKRGISIEQVGTSGMDRAFERSRQP